MPFSFCRNRLYAILFKRGVPQTLLTLVSLCRVVALSYSSHCDTARTRRKMAADPLPGKGSWVRTPLACVVLQLLYDQTNNNARRAHLTVAWGIFMHHIAVCCYCEHVSSLLMKPTHRVARLLFNCVKNCHFDTDWACSKRDKTLGVSSQRAPMLLRRG